MFFSRERYGLFGINFNDPTLERKPKVSAKLYKDIVERKKLILKCDYMKNFATQNCANTHFFLLLSIYTYILLPLNTGPVCIRIVSWFVILFL